MLVELVNILHRIVEYILISAKFVFLWFLSLFQNRNVVLLSPRCSSWALMLWFNSSTYFIWICQPPTAVCIYWPTSSPELSTLYTSSLGEEDQFSLPITREQRIRLNLTLLEVDTDAQPCQHTGFVIVLRAKQSKVQTNCDVRWRAASVAASVLSMAVTAVVTAPPWVQGTDW